MCLPSSVKSHHKAVFFAKIFAYIKKKQYLCNRNEQSMKLLSKILLLLMSLLVMSCAKEDVSEPIAFHVQVSDVKAFSTMVTITHNATNRDPYYCFVVEGEVMDINAEIRTFIKQTPTSQLDEYKHYQRKSYFSFNRLTPEKTFTIIAFGMDDKKKMYGEPGSLAFKTPKTDMIVSVNPNWIIAYEGYALYNEKDYSLITVTVQGDAEERFFLSTLTVDEEKSFGSLEELIVYCTYEFVNQKENNSESEFWLEDSAVRTGGTNFYRYLTPGNYVSYAIGINADGSPTGHYVKTPVYHVDKYPADEFYTHLLGEWVLTDSRDKISHITFEEYTVNKSLIMYGFGGLNKQGIYIPYNRSDGSFTFETQVVSDNVKVNFTSGNSAEGKLTLIGGYYDQNDKLKRTTSISTLAYVTREENGDYTVESAYYVTFEDGSELNDVGMMYMITAQDGSVTTFGLRMFPFTMKKVVE